MREVHLSLSFLFSPSWVLTKADDFKVGLGYG
jgi:hypothetical protein